MHGNIGLGFFRLRNSNNVLCGQVGFGPNFRDTYLLHVYETLKRQWAIKTYSMYSGEMDLVDQFLTKDIYNNSAWNHRYFIINNTR